MGRIESSNGRRSVLYLILALGGMLGTLMRYAMTSAISVRTGTLFPWGTLIVNVLGSLLLGFVLRVAGAPSFSPELRIFLTIGFCGAFTTFSTFSFEAFTLLEQGAWLRAFLYAAASVMCGVGAVMLGWVAAGSTLR